MSAFSIKAQELVTYQEVIQLDSTIKKDELFAYAKIWLSELIKDSKAAIEFEDKQEGRILANTNVSSETKIKMMMGTAPATSTTKFSITMMLKDGKAKIMIPKFVNTLVYRVTSTNGVTTTNSYWDNFEVKDIEYTEDNVKQYGRKKFELDLLNETTQDAKNIGPSLAESFKKKVKELRTQKSDW